MGERSVVKAGWWLLGGLLLATLAAAFFFNPAARPSAGEEVTYALQSASLAWDFDLVYGPEDRNRFAAHWGMRPRHGGPTYDEPFLYALVAAPFVRLAPVRGAVIANALLLAGATLLAARALARHLGPAAPVWVAVLVFASVAFTYVFRVQPDLFLMAATAAGFALVYGGGGAARTSGTPLADVYEGEAVSPERLGFARWLGAGLLLAVPATFHPLYLLLLLPALVAARQVPGKRRRRLALAGFGLGAVGLLAAALLVQGLPAGQVAELGEGFSPRLAGWNSLYFLVGRHCGVLPYFLPLVLPFFAAGGERGRRVLLLAVMVAAAGFIVLRPFDLQGGEGAIANRLFLPLYAALWFLAARPARLLPALIVIALAAPFLYPAWRHPAAVSLAGQPYPYVSAVAGRWLPYETSQRHVPGAAFFQHGLWFKVVSRDVWRPKGSDSLRLLGESRAELLAASSRPVEGFVLEFDARAPSRLEIRGEELRPSLLRPDGSLAFDVEAGKARAVHPLWWSRGENYHLYELDFRLPGAPAGPIRFRVLPRRDLIQKSGG
jgi:hypothetical protein